MSRAEAERLLAAHAAARDAWLHATTARLGATAEALWQVGSFRHGTADAWSDLDLLLTGAPLPLDDAAFVLVNPSNGPAGGAYAGAAYPYGPLLLWVDWYAWPAGLAAPAEARLLAGEGAPGMFSLFEALDRHGRGTGADPDRNTFTLAMLPIAAKQVARGQPDRAARMVSLLGGAPESDPVAELHRLLVAADAAPPVRERIRRTIDVAAALR